MAAATQDWAIPPGSTVLVTGCNGFIGSHVTNQFLQHGFRVRGTVRDAGKDAWMTTLFDTKYGLGRFEFFPVPDMAVPGAFDEAMRGVSAVVHTASILTLSHDPNEVIPVAVQFALNALEAAYKEPSTTRFVYCSSSTAAVMAEVGQPGVVVTEATYNEDAVRAAWAPPPYTPDRAHAVYSASKTQVEQAVWKYYRDNAHLRPDMVVNTVLPDMTLGKSLDPVNQGYPSTTAMVALLYRGQVVDFHRKIMCRRGPPAPGGGGAGQCARPAHLCLCFAARCNWGAVLAVLRRLLADDPVRLARLPAGFLYAESPHEFEARPAAEKLLRDLGSGRPSWTSLEESVAGVVEGLRGLEDAGEMAEIKRVYVY
ncbi:hypothetical protein F4808DRAFT_447937 [Astrocystis sublimbata]|nr:hypothetical protein F4808DRAFT_447937 [Astrocystis sublimbata]